MTPKKLTEITGWRVAATVQLYREPIPAIREILSRLIETCDYLTGHHDVIDRLVHCNHAVIDKTGQPIGGQILVNDLLQPCPCLQAGLDATETEEVK